MKKPEIDPEIESKLEALNKMYAELNESWYVYSLSAGNDFLLKNKNNIQLYLDALLDIPFSLIEKILEVKAIIHNFFDKKNEK
jgi:hypothetical protein